MVASVVSSLEGDGGADADPLFVFPVIHFREGDVRSLLEPCPGAESVYGEMLVVEFLVGVHPVPECLQILEIVDWEWVLLRADERGLVRVESHRVGLAVPLGHQLQPTLLDDGHVACVCQHCVAVVGIGALPGCTSTSAAHLKIVCQVFHTLPGTQQNRSRGKQNVGICVGKARQTRVVVGRIYETAPQGLAETLRQHLRGRLSRARVVGSRRLAHLIVEIALADGGF